GGIFTPRAQAFLQQVHAMNHAIEKPFDLDQVRRFVREELSRRRAVGLRDGTA
ncbi:MAG: hypothetical protein HC923_13665, partial [Myxococcales bacterium]|nr:hypothetical protein [Myxococcales bacterium]